MVGFESSAPKRSVGGAEPSRTGLSPVIDSCAGLGGFGAAGGGSRLPEIDQDVAALVPLLSAIDHTPGVSCWVIEIVPVIVIGLAPWPASCSGPTLNVIEPPLAVNCSRYTACADTTKATDCEQSCGPAGRTPEKLNGGEGGRARV